MGKYVVVNGKVALTTELREQLVAALKARIASLESKSGYEAQGELEAYQSYLPTYENETTTQVDASLLQDLLPDSEEDHSQLLQANAAEYEQLKQEYTKALALGVDSQAAIQYVKKAFGDKNISKRVILNLGMQLIVAKDAIEPKVAALDKMYVYALTWPQDGSIQTLSDLEAVYAQKNNALESALRAEQANSANAQLLILAQQRNREFSEIYAAKVFKPDANAVAETQPTPLEECSKAQARYLAAYNKLRAPEKLVETDIALATIVVAIMARDKESLAQREALEFEFVKAWGEMQKYDADLPAYNADLEQLLAAALKQKTTVDAFYNFEITIRPTLDQAAVSKSLVNFYISLAAAKYPAAEVKAKFAAFENGFNGGFEFDAYKKLETAPEVNTNNSKTQTPSRVSHNAMNRSWKKSMPSARTLAKCFYIGAGLMLLGLSIALAVGTSGIAAPVVILGAKYAFDLILFGVSMMIAAKMEYNDYKSFKPTPILNLFKRKRSADDGLILRPFLTSFGSEQVSRPNAGPDLTHTATQSKKKLWTLRRATAVSI